LYGNRHQLKLIVPLQIPSRAASFILFEDNFDGVERIVGFSSRQPSSDSLQESRATCSTPSVSGAWGAGLQFFLLGLSYRLILQLFSDVHFQISEAEKERQLIDQITADLQFLF